MLLAILASRIFQVSGSSDRDWLQRGNLYAPPAGASEFLSHALADEPTAGDIRDSLLEGDAKHELRFQAGQAQMVQQCSERPCVWKCPAVNDCLGGPTGESAGLACGQNTRGDYKASKPVGCPAAGTYSTSPHSEGGTTGKTYSPGCVTQCVTGQIGQGKEDCRGGSSCRDPAMSYPDNAQCRSLHSICTNDIDPLTLNVNNLLGFLHNDGPYCCFKQLIEPTPPPTEYGATPEPPTAATTNVSTTSPPPTPSPTTVIPTGCFLGFVEETAEDESTFETVKKCCMDHKQGICYGGGDAAAAAAAAR